jgi:hypothetical protein
MEQTYAQDDVRAGTRGLGWMTFAGVMLGFAGTFNFIDGIVAVSKSRFYVAGAVFVFSDLKTWGWIVLILGIIQVCAAFAIFAGSQWARWFGITVAAVNAIAQLMFIQAYPLWALSIFTLDVLVIYALAVYGGQDYTNEVR